MSYHVDRPAAAAFIGTPPREPHDQPDAVRATLLELEYFLDVLSRRIAAENDPATRASWRAHKRATLAEIKRALRHRLA